MKKPKNQIQVTNTQNPQFFNSFDNFLFYYTICIDRRRSKRKSTTNEQSQSDLYVDMIMDDNDEVLKHLIANDSNCFWNIIVSFYGYFSNIFFVET